VRALWSIVVVCLVAATGVQPIRAADPQDAHAQLGDRRPALLALTTTRGATVHATSRTTPPVPRLPVYMLAAPASLPRLTSQVIPDGVRDGRHHDATLLPIRSARGPPVR
jgi:hypothetical protein